VSKNYKLILFLSKMGALQFDKDLRRLVSYFSSVAHNAAKLMGTTVRGEFARLSQIASLLNLEKVSFRLPEQHILMSSCCLGERSDGVLG